ncbi:Auxin-responsive protein IAA26 [Linum perenne]
MEGSPKLLDLISDEWIVAKGNGKGDHVVLAGRSGRSSSCVEKKLELRLGLPGDDEWVENKFSMGYFRHGSNKGKESSSQTCCTKVVVDLNQASAAEKKPFSVSPQAPAPSTPANTAVPNISQKRTAPGPVVGWPPIRSFRKNLASSSSKQQQLASSDSQNDNHQSKNEKPPVEACKRGMFVKINMDGVPIGRKVDLAAYDSYTRLSTAVDELFRDLLAGHASGLFSETSNLILVICSLGFWITAQRDSSVDEEAITGILDGSGEYTLVYEDNEGDRMLVGDVPWHMFVSTVKRLRVLKSSEVSALSLGCNKQKRT